jgi:hypothetical protein
MPIFFKIEFYVVIVLFFMVIGHVGAYACGVRSEKIFSSPKLAKLDKWMTKQIVRL